MSESNDTQPTSTTEANDIPPVSSNVTTEGQSKSIKQRIEENIFIVLAGIIIATASVVTGVNQYFSSQRIEILQSRMDQQQGENQAEINRLDRLREELQLDLDRLQKDHEAEIEKLENQLALIRRRMGNNEFLDVRNFVFTNNQLVEIPEKSKFFSEDNFYASEDDSHWMYTKSTEIELVEMLTGEAPLIFSELGSLIPLHLWRSEESVSVDGHSIFTAVFPFITLQKMPYEMIEEVFGLGLELNPLSEIILPDTVDTEQYIEAMDEIFRGDAAGTLFAIVLQQQVGTALLFDDTSFELVETQKVGNVLYAQMLITLNDVTIDGTNYSHYYIRRELILISTSTDLYIVQTSVPSPELAPRDEYFNWTTAWLGDLAIVLH